MADPSFLFEPEVLLPVRLYIDRLGLGVKNMEICRHPRSDLDPKIRFSFWVEFDDDRSLRLEFYYHMFDQPDSIALSLRQRIKEAIKELVDGDSQKPAGHCDRVACSSA